MRGRSCRDPLCAADLAGEAVGRGNQLVQDARLGESMAGAVDDVELRLRPGAVEVPGILRRAGDVVAAVDDHAGDISEPPRVADQLPLLKPSPMHEIMVLDPREGDGEIVLAETG